MDYSSNQSNQEELNSTLPILLDENLNQTRTLIHKSSLPLDSIHNDNIQNNSLHNLKYRRSLPSHTTRSQQQQQQQQQQIQQQQNIKNNNNLIDHSNMTPISPRSNIFPPILDTSSSPHYDNQSTNIDSSNTTYQPEASTSNSNYLSSYQISTTSNNPIPSSSSSSSLTYLSSTPTSNHLKPLKTASSVSNSSRSFNLTQSNTAPTSSSSSSPNSSAPSSSSRRKAVPPPLSFRQDSSQSRLMVRGGSSESYKSPDGDQTRRSIAKSIGRRSSEGLQRSEMRGGNTGGIDSNNSSPGKSREEERDTLSNLYPFTSPQLTTSNLPFTNSTSSSSNSSRMSPGLLREIDSFDNGIPGGREQEYARAYSYGSESSENNNATYHNNSNNLNAINPPYPFPSPSNTYSPHSSSASNSTSNSNSFSSVNHRQPHFSSGVGLGLPFSMSAMDLSTQSSTSPYHHHHHQPSPSSQERSPGEAGMGPESPVTDRSKLIGLGELATPRWTSGVLERRWGGGPESSAQSSAVGEEFDIVGNYTEGPPQRTMYYADHSPTTTRPFISRSSTSERTAANSAALVHTSASPRSVAAANSFLPSLQSCDSINLTATGGLIDFSSGSYLPPVTSHPFPPSNPATTTSTTSPATVITRKDSSPTYSSENLSIIEHEREREQQDLDREREREFETETQDTPRKYQDAPTRRSDQWSRRNLGASVSAPTSALGPNWTRSPGSIGSLLSGGGGGNNGGRDIVGLGLDYDNNSNTGGTNLSSDGIPYGRRESNTSSASGSSSRRSSTSRPLPGAEGGGSSNSTSISGSGGVGGGGSKGHTRRPSASRSGFSHLPPSPATSGSTLPSFTGSPIISISQLSNTTSPPLPPSSFSNTSTPTATPSLNQSSNSTSNRSGPENRRLSHHSLHAHQSSPSLIAASILRQTRDFDHEGIRLEKDMDLAQANDLGTAEAMRKLDGLATASPRTKSISSSPHSNIGGTKPRTPTNNTPPSSISRSSRETDESRSRRRTRSSASASSVAVGRGEDGVVGDEAYEKSPPLPSSSTASPALLDNSPTMTSTSYFQSEPTQTQTFRQPTPTMVVPSPRSPLSFQHTALPSRYTSSNANSGSGYEIPFPSISSSSTTSSPAKRASSSSASINAGGGNSTSTASTSRDSTSGTSFSGSSSTAAGTTPSSTFNKHRRGSGGSDVSSTQSSVDLLNSFTSTSPSSAHSTRSERLENSNSSNNSGGGGGSNNRSETDFLPQFIPPVPPLPKDWESYRPTTGTTNTTGSSTSTSNQNSPRVDSSSQKSFEGGEFQQQQQTVQQQQQQEVKAPAMEPSLSNSSTSKTPTRKWSLSFGKSKSPKPPVTMKESTSYADLSKKGLLNPRAFPPQLSDTSYGRRMAASSNDIVGLATRREIDTNSKLRHSLRGDFSRNHNTASLPIPIPPRNRTSSVSSNSTAGRSTITTNTNLPTPIVVTTSPGRSRSSLLSPRRTPSSGIPFFSRKSSNAGSLGAATPPPASSKSEPEERSSGRKSILGLNFLRSNSSKKEKEIAVVVATPVALASRQTISGVPASRTLETKVTTDEFGKKASLVPKTTTSLMTRKRGKTMPGVTQEYESTPKSLGLPPMQMSALSPSTARRVDNLTPSASSSSITGLSSSSSSRLQHPTKISQLQESAKANLPRISGSPSTQSFPSISDRISNSSNSSRANSPPQSKPSTPTKIPRPFGRSGIVNSPVLASDESEVPPAVPSAASKPFRRLSSIGSKRLSSSVSSNSYPSENDSFALNSNSEFGITREPGLATGERTLSTRRRLDSETSSGIPRSRSNAGSALSSSKTFKDLSDVASSSRSNTVNNKTPRRTSLVPGEDRISSNTPRTVQSNQNSRTLTDATPTINSLGHRRTASKTLEEFKSGPAVMRRASAAIPTDPLHAALLASARSSRTSSTVVKSSGPTRISSSVTTPSLAPLTYESRRAANIITEDEVKGDEEMSAYVRRQHTKKLAAGMSAETIQKMFEFPDDTVPLPSIGSGDAAALYSRSLTDYEKEEIRDFEKIYFVGHKCDKKPASASVPANNFGYDDERGDYLLIPHDHILYRYEVIDVLGKGSFGQVLQCRDHKTGEMVAIKIIRNKKRFHHQALVEIKVLENLVKWDPEEKHFVIRMVDSFTFRGHLCIVTELLSINLYELVKANSFAGFSTTLIRRFTIQILGSLSLLRHHRVVHCDLKPENILLKHPAKSAIKVIDFGSSCFEHEKVYTYIQSRFYRSPEVILGMNYHMAIDMWSLGCIIAEMYTGYPIFPGENEQEQLACIMEVMGLPEKYLVDRSSRKRLFFDSTGAPRPVVNSKGRRRRPGTKTLAQVLKSDDEFFIDFITKCLTWDPDRRMTPDKATRHPWIAQQRQAQVQVSSREPVQSSRSSSGTTATTANSLSSTIPSHSQISTPRRIVKTGNSSSTSQHYQPSSSISQTSTNYSNNNSSMTSSIPSIAPSVRVRTQSNSTVSTSKYTLARLGSQ